MFEWNGKRFSPLTSEEKSVLKLIKTMGDQLNWATDTIPKLVTDYMDKLKSKTDKTGNHEGSWQGLNKPTLSEEGMRATVEKIASDINDFKYINYFSQLNVDASTATPIEVVDAMPDYSICMLNIGEGNTGFFNNPYDYGTFYAHKVNSSRVIMQFTFLQENKTFSAVRRKDENNDYFSGWREETITDTVDRELNNEVYVEELMEIAETYLKNDYWRYSTDSCFRTDNFIVNGKRNIDCSTFVLLALLGKRFEDSKYYHTANTNAVNNTYKWVYNFENKPNFYSYRMAERFYKNGWEIKPFADYSNLQRGDLVFYKRENPGREHAIAFRNVDHVALYYGKVNGVHKVIEVWVDGNICRIQDLQDSRENRIVMFARIPMNERKMVLQGVTPKFNSQGNEIKIKKIKNIISSNLNIHMVGNNLCEYDKVEIGSLSTTTGETSTAENRIKTGFIPCHEDFGIYNNNTPAGFSLVFICYYDRNKTFLGIDGTNTNKFYMRRVYKYNDTVITSDLLNQFRNSFMINFGGVLKPWEKGVSNEINVTLNVTSGQLTNNGVGFNELSKSVSDDLIAKIKTLTSGRMTYVYTNQLNELTIEV